MIDDDAGLPDQVGRETPAVPDQHGGLHGSVRTGRLAAAEDGGQEGEGSLWSGEI